MQKTKREDTFMRADEVATIFDCSKEFAYKIIRQLNADLQKQGFITMQGRVSRKYFQERFFG